MTQSLLAICFLHESKRCMHRDLKPGNVLVNASGIVKIGDFGVSAMQQLQDSADLPRGQTTFVGTYKYMSPERVQGGEYSMAADIWSLGVIALEAHLGHFPWKTTNGFFDLMNLLVSQDVPFPSVEDEGVTPEFLDFLQACLEKDPAKRPTAREAYAKPFIQNHRSLGPARLKEWLATIEPEPQVSGSPAAHVSGSPAAQEQ
eukprot:CAMPEP_0114541648 /NCGR_PEP_ID=MMETSP0114-20121206/1415_1 /TAXON_ID=31324 /ORGANISM="Goniomonas sp, Strain m" /LENGTH=201 /DNA_ID=CAMNT_0001725895 /DNA_START=471 /DNA_END=1076 /DNA_ORIENTATION=+